MKKYIVFLFLVLLFIVGCTEKTPEISQAYERKELVLAIGGEPEGFDPTTGWGRYGSPLFQSTLLSRDQDLQITTDLATVYEVSDDGLIWTITLRKDAKFSDGNDVTIKDVMFTFNQAKHSQSIVDLTNLAEMKEIDTYTIEFHLKKPQSTFVTVLQTLGIVPAHLYDETYAEEPIGSGPYTFVEWRKGEQLIVERNPYYYGKKPEFERLVFLFAEEDQALAQAKAGLVDVLSLPISYAQTEITGMKRLSLQSVDNRGVMLPTTAPYVNEKNEEIGNVVTQDIAIRQAMNYAVDRQAMVDGILNGEGTEAYSSVDQLPWGTDEARIEHDVTKAHTIMNKAGWDKKADGIYEKDGVRASFTLYYPSGDQMRQSLSLVFADQMNQFGIEVKTASESWNELDKLMHANPVMMGWGSHDPIELYYLFGSEMKGIDYYNSNYYENEVVDEYLTKAIHATSDVEANQYWQSIQWDGNTGVSAKGDAPWVWLVNLNHIYYINEEIDIGQQKIQPHGHGWPITDFITEWHDSSDKKK